MYHNFLKAMLHNNQEAMKLYTKMVAIIVRNEMEQFHTDHIPDKLMPELNRAIRNGIYHAIFAMVNYESDDFCKGFIDYSYRLIPGYWEEPELLPEFRTLLDELSNVPVTFESLFLNEQYESGNIYVLPGTRYLRIKGSSDFSRVTKGDGKKHLNKITSLLRKEKYRHDDCAAAYIKA